MKNIKELDDSKWEDNLPQGTNYGVFIEVCMGAARIGKIDSEGNIEYIRKIALLEDEIRKLYISANELDCYQ